MIAATPLERSLRGKVLARVIFPLAFLIFLSSLDRSNIAIAALQMNPELGLSPEMYGRGAGLFFFAGYIALQYPHTALLRRFHARRWVTATVVVWGLVAAAMSLVQDPTQFYSLRFALGVAEGGFAPGATFLAATWMPKRFRAGAMSATMLAVPVSQVLGAPLSGWLMTQNLALGPLSGWRTMIAVEGLATAAFGLLAWFVFVDRIADARWLTDEEKALAERELETDETERAPGGGPFLLTGRFWIAALIWWCLLGGAQGLMFWMAQVVKQIAGGDPFEVGLISALPWIGIGAGMIIASWSSDRTGERHRHLAAFATLGGVSFLAAFFVPTGALTVVLLLLGGLGLGGAQGVFWPIPFGYLDRASSGPGITVLNMVGNSAGLIVTPLIGVLRQASGGFASTIWLLAGFIVLAAVLVMTLPRPRGERG